MLRDNSHGKKEKKQGTMAKVEADLALMAAQQKPGQTLSECAKLFNSQVDVINANGGAAGYHPELVDEHLEVILKKDSSDREAYDKLPPDERKEILKRAIKARGHGGVPDLPVPT